MQITERSYNSKLYRPSPVIYKSHEMELIMVVTPWGEGEMRENINSEISKFIFAAQGDFEVTTPFEYNSSLTKDGNNLRMAILLASSDWYKPSISLVRMYTCP